MYDEINRFEVAVYNLLEDGVPHQQVVILIGVTAEILKCLGKIFENEVIILLFDELKDVLIVILGIEFGLHHAELEMFGALWSHIGSISESEVKDTWLVQEIQLTCNQIVSCIIEFDCGKLICDLFIGML